MNEEKRTILTQSTDRYKNPFVPQGFAYVTGEWNTGFVIADEFGNEFTWVPVGWLESNGTLDGISFDSNSAYVIGIIMIFQKKVGTRRSLAIF